MTYVQYTMIDFINDQSFERIKLSFSPFCPPSARVCYISHIGLCTYVKNTVMEFGLYDITASKPDLQSCFVFPYSKQIIYQSSSFLPSAGCYKAPIRLAVFKVDKRAI